MEALFGKHVKAIPSNVATAVSVEVAGVLARPLYVCMDRSGPEPCMAVASMSEFIQQVPGRKQYRCSECMKRTPVSDSVPLRVLHLYALVAASDSGLTPLRMKQVRLVLTAPPDTWTWGSDVQSGQALPATWQAQPTLIKDTRGTHWRYSQAESDAIWVAAGPFRGEAP